MEFLDLKTVAEEIKNSDKNIKLIYAFNGTGKTRLSMEFKELIQPSNNSEQDLKKIIYYNAFTEDLFTWDNDLENGNDRKLLINDNSHWIRKVVTEEGAIGAIIDRFQGYVLNDKDSIVEKIEPYFNSDMSEISFSRTYQGNTAEGIKISRGEESNFIWSVFYTLLETIIEQRSDVDYEDSKYRDLEYIFIDDPISSLDDRRIIDIALDISRLVKESNKNGTGLKFVITTHHSLFFNVLFNELKKNSSKFLFSKIDDKYFLEEQQNDSPFGYHLMLVKELKNAINEDRVEKYHFNFLRNLLEKTATFLGYESWSKCVVLYDEDGNMESPAPYVRRINLHSHSAFSEHEPTPLTEQEKKVLERVFNQLLENFRFFKE